MANYSPISILFALTLIFRNKNPHFLILDLFAFNILNANKFKLNLIFNSKLKINLKNIFFLSYICFLLIFPNPLGEMLFSLCLFLVTQVLVPPAREVFVTQQVVYHREQMIHVITIQR